MDVRMHCERLLFLTHQRRKKTSEARKTLWLYWRENFRDADHIHRLIDQSKWPKKTKTRKINKEEEEFFFISFFADGLRLSFFRSNWWSSDNESRNNVFIIINSYSNRTTYRSCQYSRYNFDYSIVCSNSNISRRCCHYLSCFHLSTTTFDTMDQKIRKFISITSNCCESLSYFDRNTVRFDHSLFVTLCFSNLKAVRQRIVSSTFQICTTTYNNNCVQSHGTSRRNSIFNLLFVCLKSTRSMPSVYSLFKLPIKGTQISIREREMIVFYSGENNAAFDESSLKNEQQPILNSISSKERSITTVIERLSFLFFSYQIKICLFLF